LEIGFTDIRRRSRRCEGYAWWPNHVAGSLETEAHGHLHALFDVLSLGRSPAGSQGGKEIADIVEIVVGLLVFGSVVLRRHALDRQLKILAIGIVDLGNAGSAIENAAE